MRLISQIATNNKKQTSQTTSDGDQLRDHFDKAHEYLKHEVLLLNHPDLTEIIEEFD